MKAEVANLLRAAWDGQMSETRVREFCQSQGVEVTAEQVDAYYTAREHAADSIVTAIEGDANAH